MSERIMIRCRENGPLILPANFGIVDHLGNEFALPVGKEMIALCRCGHSKNKPFCDGQHKQVGFQAGEVAVKREITPDPTSGCDTTSGGR